jgi:hypothetical protein
VPSREDGAISLLSNNIRSWSRSWGRIGATVATFALAVALPLSFAPAAGAFERFGSPVQISGDSLTALTLGDFGGTGSARGRLRDERFYGSGGANAAMAMATNQSRRPPLADIVADDRFPRRDVGDRQLVGRLLRHSAIADRPRANSAGRAARAQGAPARRPAGRSMLAPQHRRPSVSFWIHHRTLRRRRATIAGPQATDPS